MRLVASFLTAFAVLTPAAQASASPVSIRTVPASPAEGRPVDLIASSQGNGVTYSWDLDGDGAFGDASGATITRTFPVGTQTVSVRATDGSGIVSTETRSVTTSPNFAPTIGISTTTVMDLDRSYQIGVNSWDEDGEVVKFEFDLDGDGTFEVTTPVGDPWQKRWSSRADVAFDTPGDHLVRARATDDQGATAVATMTVHVRESEPWAYLNVYSDQFDHAPVAGQAATVEAYSVRPGAKYEFDLDGDGTYELDKGATSRFETALSAGTHVIGARITDTRGGVTEQRITTFVYQPADAFADKFFARRFEVSATVGEPTDLTINVEPYTRVYTIEWDADGDGDFDDGTFTTPGGDGPNSSIGHNTYTYTAPGIYDQRVRVSRAGLPTRIFSSKIFVGTRSVDRTPPYLSFGSGFAINRGEPSGFDATSSSYYDRPSLSFDLDGDGEFDEAPSYRVGLYYWTFTAPVTASIKATDPVSGKSVVGTMQMQPGTHEVPSPTLNVGDGRASYVIDDAAGATCCSAAWDTDGDGAYDDGSGATAVIPTTAGAHTVGLRVTDGLNHSAFVRKTFAVATQSAKTLPLKLKPRFTKAKLGALLKRGLRVKPGCPVACRATVVVAIDKATAKRLKLRSTVVGKGSGKGSTITVKLNAKARKALRKTRRVKLKVAIMATGADGRVGTSSKTLTIRK